MGKKWRKFLQDMLLYIYLELEFCVRLLSIKILRLI